MNAKQEILDMLPQGAIEPEKRKRIRTILETHELVPIGVQSPLVVELQEALKECMECLGTRHCDEGPLEGQTERRKKRQERWEALLKPYTERQRP